MNEEEYRQLKRKFDLTDQKLCDAILNKTGAIIKAKHIRSTFDREGRLGEPMTAVMRLFFEGLENWQTGRN